MTAKSFAKGFARGVGWVFLALAGILAYLALTSLIGRLRFGPGLMFADVEIFTALMLFFGLLGGGLLWLGRLPKEPTECRADLLPPPDGPTRDTGDTGP